jgi:HEAT repeat protein
MKLRRLVNILILVQALGLSMFLTGCSLFDLGGANLNSDDPSLKIPAMRQAGQNHDQTAIPALIDALSSDDAAVRFYAINSLQQITGQQLGFIYYAPESQRDAAIERWKAWLAKNSTTKPGSA